MEEVIIDSLVSMKLRDLEEVLFYKGYFSYKEKAHEYVHAIIEFIYSIPTQRHYETSKRKYGAWYCKYKPNKNTTWFISFDTDGELFVVRNITNNHTPDYPGFIKSI